MVGIRKTWRHAIANGLAIGLAMIVGLLWVAVASAAVTARVDRPTVDLNESFTLEVVVDSNTDLEPDLTVLREQFHVGQVSKLSNTSIFNGDIQRSLTWSVALMPKNTGVQHIPAIEVGNEQSNPVRIVVNEPTNAPPGEADVFVTSEVDIEETFVQAQILYRIRVYRAVATRQPALREPTITGTEALIELAGEERQYESVLNGRPYNVVERVIALYPQESGEIEISPARFEARVLRDGRITGRKVFESESHKITVLPIPAPPADLTGAAWLPARDVQLSEEWSQSPDEMEAGEPVTRIVTLSALGQIETQLPTIEAPEVDGLNVYADMPELSRVIEADGIRGVRRDQYAIIGLVGGELELPQLEVPWWDTEAGEWRVATLPARTLTVGGGEPPPVIEEPTAVVAPAATASPVQPLGVDSAAAIAATTFWQRAAEVLAVLWILTLAAWWWSSRTAPRRSRESRVPEEPPVQKQQKELLKVARKAAGAGDGGGVRTALLQWARLQWPDDAPRSLGDLSNRVAAPLADELRNLSAASYSANGGGWDTAALASALRSIALITRKEDAVATEPLPPLMPPAS